MKQKKDLILHLLKIIIINYPKITNPQEHTRVEIKNIPNIARHSIFTIFKQKEQYNITGYTQGGEQIIAPIDHKGEMKWKIKNCEKKRDISNPMQQLQE